MSSLTEWIIFVGLVMINLLAFVWVYRRGKRALAIFPDINQVNVRYRDKYASAMALGKRAYAKKNRLDIVVTEQELWLRTTYILLASIMNRLGFIVKIPLSQVQSAKFENKAILLTVVYQHQVEMFRIKTKAPKDFLEAIQQHKK